MFCGEFERARPGGRMGQPVPSTAFRTGALAPEEQFEAWRERIGVIFDVSPLSAPARGGFLAEADSFHLGEMVMTRTQFAPQQFLRSERQLRADMIDHYLVQYYRQGGYVGEVNGRALEIHPGSVSVLDLAQPLHTQACAAENVNLIVPRDVMDALLPGGKDLHGAVLKPASGTLLIDHLASLERRLPELDAAQVPFIARATCDLLAASILPNSENLERAHEQIQSVRLQQARRFIDRNLGSADLSPERICRSLGFSRSQLYALFTLTGGVAEYVRKRRLARVHAALADPADRRSIASLATAYGFSSQAQLSRAFRQHFGYTPSDIRRDASVCFGRTSSVLRFHRHAQDNGPNFDDWIRGLRS